jgi:outer membrane immunogenic protein
MRWSSVSATVLLLAPGIALAADLPVAPRAPVLYTPAVVQTVGEWTGFYLGGNFGAGMARAQSDFSAGGVPFATTDGNLWGPIGGAQAGYNWQSSAAVLGMEADFQWSNLKGNISAQCAVCAPATSASYEHDVDWFGTVRGRLGYAGGGWLAYVTGGYAYGRVGFNGTASGGGVSATLTNHVVQNGWTVGAGTELALAAHWSAKLEYLYVDLGTPTNTVAIAGLPTLVDRSRLQMNVTRAGVNYRF